MHKWKERNRRTRLERRFEFENYQLTRDFLDRLAKICEEEQQFPDVSFGKTYVNLTLRPENEEDDNCLTDKEHQMALKIDELLPNQG